MGVARTTRHDRADVSDDIPGLAPQLRNYVGVWRQLFSQSIVNDKRRCRPYADSRSCGTGPTALRSERVPPSLLDIDSVLKDRRVYKVFEVNTDTETVESMKIRHTPS